MLNREGLHTDHSQEKAVWSVDFPTSTNICSIHSLNYICMSVPIPVCMYEKLRFNHRAKFTKHFWFI